MLPNSVEEVQAIVRDQNYSNLKAIGSRHCFNTIADTKMSENTAHISLENLKEFEVMEKNGEYKVKFGAGFNYSMLITKVDENGLAI